MSSHLPIPPPPPGFVQLRLCQEDDIYLEIPIQIICSCCVKPVKYLRYIGWCVLGRMGRLFDELENEASSDDEIMDRGIYRYSVEEDGPIFGFAVDLEVIEKKSSIRTSDATRGPFATQLLERDGRCVWTRVRAVDGIHFIPFSRGDEWLQIIVNNRPPLGEDFGQEVSIDDIRNGVIACPNIHRYFDKRDVAVLVTPNPILSRIDVPPRHQLQFDIGNAIYPANCRYTLQWIVQPEPSELYYVPHNSDAAFVNDTLPKPSPLLLHYLYGSIAVQKWGKRKEDFINRIGILRPPRIPTPPLGPKKTKGRRTDTIKKLEMGRSRDDRQDGGGGGRGKGQQVAGDEEQDEEALDAEEIVLLFWSNTPASRERRAKEGKEFVGGIEKWRTSVC